MAKKQWTTTNCLVSFLGFNRPYDEVLAYMHERHRALASAYDGHTRSELLLLEHHPVITLTRQHLERSIKTSKDAITKDGIHIAMADRGGDATFHGPGQLIGYPLVYLREKHWHTSDGNVDLERYIRLLEQCLLSAVHKLGFTKALRVPGFTGVWYRCDDKAVELKKLIAIGVGIKDFVTKHGFALNIDIDHQRFSKHIVPCGLKDRGVVTLKEIALLESLCMPTRDKVIEVIVESLELLFDKPEASLIP